MQHEHAAPTPPLHFTWPWPLARRRMRRCCACRRTHAPAAPFLPPRAPRLPDAARAPLGPPAHAAGVPGHPLLAWPNSGPMLGAVMRATSAAPVAQTEIAPHNKEYAVCAEGSSSTLAELVMQVTEARIWGRTLDRFSGRSPALSAAARFIGCSAFASPPTKLGTCERGVLSPCSGPGQGRGSTN